MDEYPAAWPLEKPALLLLLLIYLLIGALYAVQVPAWQAPDEPAHYNYVAQLHRDGCCPVMAAGDYDQAYLDAIRGAKFDPAATRDRLDTVQYEDHQPPLYYLLQWPVFALSGGSLPVMRMASVLIGAGVVLLTWAVVRALFPVRPWMALAAAAFVALLPQHLAMMAAVNNDSLAELWVGAVLLVSVLYVRADELAMPRPHPALLGVLVGMAGLTKTTIYFTGLVALAALFLRWRRQRPALPWRGLVRAGLWVLLLALLVNAPWWLRNAQLYGFPDFTGLARHDAVVVGQPRTADWIAREGFGGWLGRLAGFTYQSFWGQFGWMAVPMPAWVYRALLGFSGFVVVGVGLGIWRNRRKAERVTRGQVDGVMLLALALLLTAGQYLAYNLAFVQHQGRYLFPALPALGFVVALGLDGWMRPLVGWRLPLWTRWLPAGGLAVGFAGLSLLALWRFILPALAL